MFDLTGMTALVTGASGGIGSAIAKALAAHGARVALSGTREDALKAVAAEIGGDVVILPCNLGDAEAVDGLVPRAVEALGKLDILVNNAGVLRRASVEDASLEDWRFVQAVNVEGTFLGIKHCIPAMRASGGGSIINVSSTAAVQGYATGAAYSASKGAVLALTRSVAVHCMRNRDNIRCNAIFPHVAESPMVHAALEQDFAGIPEAERPRVAMGSPFAVANTVLFLASDESSDLNGTSINLDRGTACIVGQLPD